MKKENQIQDQKPSISRTTYDLKKRQGLVGTNKVGVNMWWDLEDNTTTILLT